MQMSLRLIYIGNVYVGKTVPRGYCFPALVSNMHCSIIELFKTIWALQGLEMILLVIKEPT